MSDEITGAKIMGTWKDGVTIDDVFRVDHAKQLADVILCVNRNWLDRFHEAIWENDIAPDETSYELQKVFQGWCNDIEIACKARLCGMSEEVNQYRKMAVDARNMYPAPPYSIWPSLKPGEGVEVKSVTPLTNPPGMTPTHLTAAVLPFICVTCNTRMVESAIEVNNRCPVCGNNVSKYEEP